MPVLFRAVYHSRPRRLTGLMMPRVTPRQRGALSLFLALFRRKMMALQDAPCFQAAAAADAPPAKMRS